jgi:hypothetical protein
MTNRQTINSFRKLVQERNADTEYTNQDLYNILIDQAHWLIKREIYSGKIYSNNSLFQTLGCQEVIETSTIDECCPVKVNCKIYRTKEKLPETWIDSNGPVLRAVTSVDGTTEFFVTSPTTWQNKRKDPYQQMSSLKYVFPADGYLWFPEHNPHFVNVVGFYTDDISSKSKCKKDERCVRFMDMQFPLPDWLHAEMMQKAIQLMIPSKQMQPDEQIDKNTNRKN